MEFSDDFDGADDVGVEFGELFGGDPIFLVNGTADCLHFESSQLFGSHLKLCYESCLLL